MKVLVLGSGPTGMLAGAALAERGHEVTSVDRDPGPAADGTWRRRGVMQFDHAHGFRPQVAEVLQRRWPAGYDAWMAAGAEPMVVEVPGAGTRNIGNRSRRSVLERALRSAAADTPGLTLRVGHVDGLLPEDGRVTGAVVEKVPLAADLVVDASGRSSRIDRTTDPELEGLCGLAYVDRTYQLLPGAGPGPMDNPLGSFSGYDGYQVLLFLHEAGHFSVLFVCPTADDALKPLRLDAVFDQACRAVPALALWTDPDRARPTSPVIWWAVPCATSTGPSAGSPGSSRWVTPWRPRRPRAAAASRWPSCRSTPSCACWTTVLTPARSPTRSARGATSSSGPGSRTTSPSTPTRWRAGRVLRSTWLVR